MIKTDGAFVPHNNSRNASFAKPPGANEEVTHLDPAAADAYIQNSRDEGAGVPRIAKFSLGAVALGGLSLLAACGPEAAPEFIPELAHQDLTVRYEGHLKGSDDRVFKASVTTSLGIEQADTGAFSIAGASTGEEIARLIGGDGHNEGLSLVQVGKYGYGTQILRMLETEHTHSEAKGQVRREQGAVYFGDDQNPVPSIVVDEQEVVTRRGGRYQSQDLEIIYDQANVDLAEWSRSMNTGRRSIFRTEQNGRLKAPLGQGINYVQEHYLGNEDSHKSTSLGTEIRFQDKNGDTWVFMTNRIDQVGVATVQDGTTEFRGSVAALRAFNSEAEYKSYGELNTFSDRWNAVSDGGNNTVYTVVPERTPDGKIGYAIINNQQDGQEFARLVPTDAIEGTLTYEVVAHGTHAAVINVEDGRDDRGTSDSNDDVDYTEIGVELGGCPSFAAGNCDSEGAKMRNLELTQMVFTALMDQVDDEQKDSLNPIHEALATASAALEFGDEENVRNPELSDRRAVLAARLTQEENSLDVVNKLVYLLGVDNPAFETVAPATENIEEFAPQAQRVETNLHAQPAGKVNADHNTLSGTAPITVVVNPVINNVNHVGDGGPAPITVEQGGQQIN